MSKVAAVLLRRSTAAQALEAGAFGLIAYGCWLVLPWLGLIVGGILLALLAAVMER